MLTELKDTEFTRTVLSEIDKASYNDKLTFIGRSKQFGSLFKNTLSSGTKTLLSIQQFEDVCFDLSLCGNNAKCLLPLLSKGNILLKDKSIIYAGRGDCDIVCNNKHYSNFYDFLGSLKEEV